MKRIITVAIVFLGVCSGIYSITFSLANSSESHGMTLISAGQGDAGNAFVDQRQKNKSDSSAAGLNPHAKNENTGLALPDLYVQAMGTKCVTPYTICDIDPQPINYPCCCDDGTCGYVSQ